MQIVFEFIDGPLEGKRLVGDSADERTDATALYRLTREGTVGTGFFTHSDLYRRAIEELEAGEIDDVGGPYEEYLYEVAERSERAAEVCVCVKFVSKVIGGTYKASDGEGLV